MVKNKTGAIFVKRSTRIIFFMSMAVVDPARHSTKKLNYESSKKKKFRESSKKSSDKVQKVTFRLSFKK